jgi:D-beta-D-heptose 7-phosphate kinase/D-beta-D-heptose 1-phosphate adenosyltransferase
MNYRTDKILSLDELASRLDALRAAGRKIVFTNGCFDVLHIGHVRLLETARAAGDALVVAINSDGSVRGLNKGDDRPVHPETDRAELLAALAAVDFVIVFDQPTPAEAIARVRPDVLVKGGDWGPDAVVGREFVEAHGGRVVRVPIVPGHSTTRTVEKIKEPR